MCDVFEGRIWGDFQTVNSCSFLGSPRNYGFMLNVDWMQPFDHTPYSVGVLYLILMNLPRSEHFKRQNIFLLGIIPGPSEQWNNINSFLAPLVDELYKLWHEGALLRHSGSVIPELFKLLCCVLHVIWPQARKFAVSLPIIQCMVATSVRRNLRPVPLASPQTILALTLVLLGT